MSAFLTKVKAEPKKTDFKVNEDYTEDANILDMMKQKELGTDSKTKINKDKPWLRRTGQKEKTKDVVMDVYVGVLEEKEKKPLIQELNTK